MTIVDRGGTFTDVCAHTESGRDYVLKLLSVDPANYDDAPTEGIRRILNQILTEEYGSEFVPFRKGEPIDLSSVESVRMGTTVATNALLERKGDRVAFLVTKGFKDILIIGQQARPSIFDLSVNKLGHLHEQVYEIDERVTIEGYSEDPNAIKVDEQTVKDDPSLVYGVSGEAIRILRRPDVLVARDILHTIWDSGIRSLAICLMHSFTYPDHEKLIAKEARNMGFDDVSVSSEIQPMIKLVSRANSSTADAYLSPITMRYIAQFGKGFKGGLNGLDNKLLFMQSDGGLTTWSKFSGLRAILSGPAGGVVGYAKTSYEQQDEQNEQDRVPPAVLGFDMGGTSTDVSRYNGSFEHIFETTTAQVTIQAPQLDINTVAAGGGSILFWKKGLFVVGPESASAHPGPACYRKGGPLTVTDANLFLGRILPEYFPKIFGPNEDQALDEEIVRIKFAELTKEINRDKRALNEDDEDLVPEQVAMGFLTVANEAMCRPIRSLTEGKGYAANRHHLASFGGAGGQHACAVATNLGISRVIIHKYSSILSAYGMTLADVVYEVQRPESTVLDAQSLVGLEQRLDNISAEAFKALQSQGFTDSQDIETEKYLNLRYRGTETLIMTKKRSGFSKVEDYIDSFVSQHRQEFGFSLEREILVGDIRVRGIGKSKIGAGFQSPGNIEHYRKLNVGQSTSVARHKVYFETVGSVDSQVFKLDDLVPGTKVKGPAVIIDQTQTIIVAPDCVAIALPKHIIIDISYRAQASSIAATGIDPIQLSVFGHRFMSIAEQMGKTLQKTAISTNIKERLDFSCAIFGPDGGLVANAPHIPVHLGSMSSAVAYQQKKWHGQIKNGDVIVANHPAYGGSHLPDITVMTPVFSEDEKTIMFWTASRGHHSDIGGITAGSMPPFSKEIWEEGATIEGFKVVKEFQFDEDGLVDLLYRKPAQYPGCSGSRSLSDSISDLKAQIAANNKGIGLLKSLIQEYSLEVVQLYMHGIQENAERSVRQLLKTVIENQKSSNGANMLVAEDQIDDGTVIKLKIDIDGETGNAVFDFTGTGPQVYGNLNAPRSITYSAILYVLRSMISDDIPLNQGCLTPIQIIIPDGTLLSATPDAATVGGNVETSQRITDVILKAFSYMGASQGTCNNLTFGYGGRTDGTGGGFGYYETIAGGAGAGPTWDGQSGVQVHMTNTRSTDPEILEKRYPCILHEFSLREGSGGNGYHRGGDGVIRDIEFRVPVQLSILSERRASAPYGMNGGRSGMKGQNLWIRAKDGLSISLGGKNTVMVEAGDRIVVKTPGGGGYGNPLD